MAEQAPKPRTPTRDELTAIQSGAGMIRWGGGPPHSETNPNFVPHLLQGLHPNPGLAHQILTRSPICGPAIRLVEDHMLHLNWRWLPPREAVTDGGLVDNELGQLAVMQWIFRNLAGGFPRYLRGILRSMPYGFSLAEMVWDYLEDDVELTYLVPQPEGATPQKRTVTIPAGFAYPSRTRWLNSWTIKDWVLDAGYPGASGDVTGIMQTSEKGLVHIVREKLQHFARGFHSDNPTGVSTLRSVAWVDRAFADELVSDRVSRERWGEGTIVAEWTGDGNADYKVEQIAQIEDVIDDFTSGRQGYMVVLPGWKISLDFGGSSFPDPIPRMSYYQQLIGRALGDVVKDLGTGKFGSKAGMEVVAGESQRQLSGICHDYCTCIAEEMVRPIARMNGWDLNRIPVISASGFIDASLMTQVYNFANASLLGERPDDEDNFRRILGLEN